MPLVLVDYQEPIGVLTFNHDQRRNALSREFIGEFLAGLDDLVQRRARVVIIRSQPGAKVWSAGFNIQELPRPGHDPLPYFHPLEEAIRAIQNCPAPVIAMMEGSVWGGACEMAFVCDILIGTETTSFAITPAKIGVPYNPTGILHLMNAVGLGLAREMFFTGQPVPAARAYQLGILNHLKPAAELEAFTMDMARQIAANSPISIAVMKEQMQLFANAMPLTAATFERIQALRRRVYESQDYQEGQQAFLEKRTPVFRGE
jgi:methylmalonyl-CoA decarboxylase